MSRLYFAFLRGISLNMLTLVGVALATASFISFILFEILRLIGALTNAYIGLIIYLAFPSAFVLGLVLIPVGWYVHSKKTGRSVRAILTERFEDDKLARTSIGSKVFRTAGLLTLINLVFIGIISTRALHFMDQPNFCGAACHSVMNPEWTTYQDSPHARVKCVECHVGEGIDALIDAKLNGAWQIISLTFDLYERPIPTPVHNLRPARETCEKCHWPDKFHGNRIKTIVNYSRDSLSTPKYTTLMMKIGSGRKGSESGAHWHVSKDNIVRYASINDERYEINWVDVKRPDGTYRRFTNNKLSDELIEGTENLRTMDCVDCHNRATHIYERPESTINRKMREGKIDPSLPFIKSRALSALTSGYPDENTALKNIDLHIRNFYMKKYPRIYSINEEKIDDAIKILQSTYQRNIHHRMNIDWGAYPSHLGHKDGRGCFRCHNTNIVDEDGKSLSMDCTMCHSILAFEDDEPFEYLQMVQVEGDTVVERQREYLRDEFREAVGSP